MSVWEKKKSKFEETVLIFVPPLFSIQVKIHLKYKWENTHWRTVTLIYSANAKVTHVKCPNLAFPCLAYQQLLCIEGILIWL